MGNMKLVWDAKKTSDEVYSKYYDANKQLWKLAKDTYGGKYVLCKSEDGYVGVAYVVECKKDYGIRGKILLEDGYIDNWVVINIAEILADYELCSYDKAISIFPSLAHSACAKNLNDE